MPSDEPIQSVTREEVSGSLSRHPDSLSMTCIYGRVQSAFSHDNQGLYCVCQSNCKTNRIYFFPGSDKSAWADIGQGNRLLMFPNNG